MESWGRAEPSSPASLLHIKAGSNQKKMRQPKAFPPADPERGAAEQAAESKVPPPSERGARRGARPPRTYYGDKHSGAEVTPWVKATRGGKRKEDVVDTDRQTDTMRHNETARSRPPPRPDPRKNRRALRCQNAAGVSALGGEQGVSPTTPRSHQQPLKSSGRGAKGTWGVWCLHGTRPPQAQRHICVSGRFCCSPPLSPWMKTPCSSPLGLRVFPTPLTLRGLGGRRGRAFGRALRCGRRG